MKQLIAIAAFLVALTPLQAQEAPIAAAITIMVNDYPMGFTTASGEELGNGRFHFIADSAHVKDFRAAVTVQLEPGAGFRIAAVDYIALLSADPAKPNWITLPAPAAEIAWTLEGLDQSQYETGVIYDAALCALADGATDADPDNCRAATGRIQLMTK